MSVGNAFIDGTLVPVDVALSAVRRRYIISFEMAEPAVGSLKFVPTTAVKSNSSIDYRNADFDGWLYPDGSTFDLADFALSAQLKQLYGSRYSTKFTLPDFRNFMKLNGNGMMAGSSMMGVMPGLNVLPSHTHNLDGTMNVNASLKIKLPAGNAGRPGGENGTTGRRGMFHACSKANVEFMYNMSIINDTKGLPIIKISPSTKEEKI